MLKRKKRDTYSGKSKHLTKIDKPLNHSNQGWHYQMKTYRCALSVTLYKVGHGKGTVTITQ